MFLKYVLALFVFFPFFPTSSKEASVAVTYEMKKGRFGDNLLSFSHAAWFSHVLGFPLVYKPFQYSERLKMHDDPSLLRIDSCAFQNLYYIHSHSDFLRFFNQVKNSNFIADTLLVIPFYPDSSYLYDEESDRAQFTAIDWNDQAFVKLLRSFMEPVYNYPKPNLPLDRVSVALHYRTGGNYDKGNWQRRFPLKCPPHKFYRQALRKLCQIIDKPLYVYIFTDSLHPEELQQRFEKEFAGKDILFDCRKEGNSDEQNVLEDFFAMGSFDCLIRPESNYSIMVSHLFPFEIVISPVHFKAGQDTIEVDRFQVEVRPSKDSDKRIVTILRD